MRRRAVIVYEKAGCYSVMRRQTVIVYEKAGCYSAGEGGLL